MRITVVSEDEYIITADKQELRTIKNGIQALHTVELATKPDTQEGLDGKQTMLDYLITIGKKISRAFKQARQLEP